MSYRFGPFELDSHVYELRRDGEVIHAQPLVLELLAHLIAHRDRIVGKEDLVREVWSGQFVADASVSRAISQLRTALGDSGEEQRWIATVHGRGYRFVGELEGPDRPEDGETPGPDTAAPEEAAGASVAPLRRLTQGRRLRKTWIAVAAAALLAGSFGAWRLSRSAADPAPTTTPRLLVLPFAAIGPSEDPGFAAGLTEETTTRLAGIRGLAVLSRATGDHYQDLPVARIAAELDVDYVLEGGVRIDDGREAAPARLRITPQLISTASGEHVWTRVYERELADVFAVQADIAERVAEALDLELQQRQAGEPDPPATRDGEAAAAYLRGLDVHARARAPNDYRLAAGLFRRATEHDPRFAAAFARRAIALAELYRGTAESWPDAIAALEGAQALAPRAVDTLLAEGFLAFHGPDSEHERAAVAFQRVLERSPSSSRAMSYLGSARRRQGRLEEAARHYRRALELDPQNRQTAANVPVTLHALRAFDEADAAYARATSIAPDSGPWGHWAKMQIAWRGDVAAAEEVLTQRPEGVAVSADLRTYLALCAGRFDDAARYADEVPADALAWPPFYAAESYRRVGRDDRVQAIAEAQKRRGDSLVERFPDSQLGYHALLLSDYLHGRWEQAKAHALTVHRIYESSHRFHAPQMLEAVAIIEARAGHHQEAIAILEALLETDYAFPITPGRLALEPWWEPLREEPGFRALVEPGT